MTSESQVLGQDNMQMASSVPPPYMTEQQGIQLMFPYDYQQTFHHEFRFMHTPREYVLVPDFHNMDEAHKACEKTVLKYLLNFGFATIQQLRILLSANGLDTEILPDILESCVEQHVLNYFILSQFVLDSIPSDACKIYCLDHGAKMLLQHYSPRDYIGWISSDNYRSSELVAKYLMTGMFYLQLLATKGERISYFNPLPDFTIGHREIRFSAAFQLVQGFATRDFLLEVVRHEDLPIIWQKKVNEKIAVFLQDKFWSCHYHALPVFLFLTPNDEDALMTADIFHMRTKHPDFRVLTDQNLMMGFDKARFYQYVPGTEMEPAPRLKRTHSKIFSSETN